MGSHSRSNRPPPAEQVAETLAAAAQQAPVAAGRLTPLLRLLFDLDAAHPGRVDREGEALLDRLLASAWTGGWQLADLVELAQRRLPAARPMLIDAMAAEHVKYAESTVDPRWRAQLDQLGARAWWQPDRPLLPQWARRDCLARSELLHGVVSLAGFLLALPKLPRLLPPPGSAYGSASGADRPADVDEKVLARIRALLAKAESTDFPEEAEALSSKAQELMAKFSLDRTLVDASVEGSPAGAQPLARRIWLDAPYVSAKIHLVSAVATANRCRTVFTPDFGFTTILGDEVDLRLVELLATSLLLQANRAMLRAGRGQSRIRSFRQSFLIAYATRVGERLHEAAAATEREADAAANGRLLPALAKRGEQVEALVQDLFPRLTNRDVRVSNREGWAAGRTAADLANLNARHALA
ncbi:DUF2786 domain-containing protein [Flindersiella endophytica]